MGIAVIHEKKEWQSIVLESDTPVLVDFYAQWCGPCKMISPFLETLSTTYPRVLFVKLDVDAVPDVAEKCGISAMPTFQVFVNGVKVAELVGASKDKLEALVKVYSA